MKSRVAGVVAVVLPTALVALHGLLYGRWIVDDAAITFAYARSVATGAGPVLQPGADPVEGYSNPAWLVILVLGRWLGLFDRGAWFGVPDVVAFPKLVALLCCAGIFAAFYAVARAVSPRPALLTVIAGAATAAVPSFVIWVVSGLENPLLAVAAVSLGALLARAGVAGRLLHPRTALLCGVLAALLALTRPDGLVYAFAYPLAVLLLVRQRQLRRAIGVIGVHVAAFALPTGTYLVWRFATFGAYLPNTALAKAQGVPAPEELGRPAELVGYTGWLTAILVVGVIAAGMRQRGPTRTTLALLLIPLGLAVTAFAVLQGDWMGEYRFATPVWPLIILAATLAAARVAAELSVRTRAALITVVVVAVGLTGQSWAGAAQQFRAAPTVPLCAVAGTTGVAPNLYADLLGVRDPVLLAPDVGGTALTSTARIVDLAGLTDARMAELWRSDDMAGLRDHVFDEVQPTFIRTHDGWSGPTGIVADPRMAADYVPIILVDPQSGMWVRRDAVDGDGDGDAELMQLREYAVSVEGMVRSQYQNPRGSCGDTLPVGAQLPS